MSKQFGDNCMTKSGQKNFFKSNSSTLARNINPRRAGGGAGGICFILGKYAEGKWYFKGYKPARLVISGQGSSWEQVPNTIQKKTWGSEFSLFA